MTRQLDIEFGAAELTRDDPLVEQAVALGWTRYDESFNEDMYCIPVNPDLVGLNFQLSGSQTQLLCCVYDPAKWKIDFLVFTEDDDEWLHASRREANERRFYGERAA